ncbi:beta-1,4-glucuronyltransferase 1 isoform X2 [Bradysia coprophila]|uniref:beta-1,4-glucuronyltransferase 1 isoform X2 n=1 Tax=Bradysia coprophila TaxID=38358 RepID=UPI00187D76AA|nr:beta-1,4-glucuronyltransferase 1 isoform X2 [Bradysia coprophila]
MIQICRLWNLSLASVLALTISNILLTVRLLHSNDCPLEVENDGSMIPKVPPPTQPPCYIIADTTNVTDQPVFLNLKFHLGRWDSLRLYKYFDFAVTGERFKELSEQYVVCLATQGSLEKLYSLVQVAHHFSGPISAAVFAAGNDELYLLQLYVTYLRKCYPAIRNSVSFHLAVPKDRAPTYLRDGLNEKFSRFNCAQPETTLNELMKYRSIETTKWRTKNPYPQNHLRNVARKGCQNDFVFLTDVDIIPSMNFAEKLDKFLRTAKCQSAKCAFVIPTYEIDNRVKFPKDKLDLIRLAKKGLARPFHHKVFIYNQFATNFSKWESDLDNTRETRISYNVTNFEFLYEPFYVSTDLVPVHDERFLGYGFTRNTQTYEMFVAGYQFQVLSPIFTCHWGLQNKKNRPAWRERQNNINRKILDIFKREVFARYHKDPLKMMQPKKAAKRGRAK